VSLERFNLKENILHPLLMISFINFILVLIVLLLSATIFAKPSGIQLEFPLLKEEGGLAGKEVVIVVNSENVIYVDGHVVTLSELRRFLAQGNFRRNALIIRVDTHASMGRVADILDLCRGIPGATVNVSTI
jgi:biopolymer transport protein ExbD